MKTVQLVAPLLGLMLLAGCNKQPVAKIDASKTSAKVGEAIQFTNDTENGETFEWEFGDGTESDEREPSKTYTKAGNYNVEMTAYSKKEKKKDSDDIDIVITERNNAAFVGTHAMTSDYYMYQCVSGSMISDSDEKGYSLVIRAGSNDNEILIDNLGGLGINNVKATVTKVSFFGMELYSFTVASGQTLTDSQGRIWNYSSNDIRGDYDPSMSCREVSVYLNRTITCGGFTYTSNYSENAGTAGCF